MPSYNFFHVLIGGASIPVCANLEQLVADPPASPGAIYYQIGIGVRAVGANGATWETLGTGGGGGNQNIASVLGVGDDADGQNIVNIGSTGIGTDTPNGPLQVRVAPDCNLLIHFQNPYTAISAVNDDNSANISLTLRAIDIYLMPQGGGRVGVGTTTPSEILDVAGNVQATAFIGDGSLLTGLGSAAMLDVGFSPGNVVQVGGGGTIDQSLIPATPIVDFLGASANQAAMLALVPDSAGDFTVRNDTGTVWVYLGTDPTQLANWLEAPGISGVISWNGSDGIVSVTTSELPEGSNHYYTDARFNTSFAAKSTTGLAEGSNLYFTDVRAQTACPAVTIGTANGLSLSTQALSLAAATTGTPGAMSAADKTNLNALVGSSGRINGGTVSATPQTALGTGGTALASGVGSSFTLTLTSGSVGTPATGDLATIAFGTTFGATPRIVFSGADANGSLGSALIYATANTTGATITARVALTFGQVYTFNVLVV